MSVYFTVSLCLRFGSLPEQEITGGKERPDVIGQASKGTKNNHWDFLLKEMMWMAGDFEGERKRHMVSERMAWRYQNSKRNARQFRAAWTMMRVGTHHTDGHVWRMAKLYVGTELHEVATWTMTSIHIQPVVPTFLTRQYAPKIRNGCSTAASEIFSPDLHGLHMARVITCAENVPA